MKYFLIAGEPSGDQHGSLLMQAIRRTDPGASFQFFGGDGMESVGGPAVRHIRDLAYMGFTQLITRLPAIRKNFTICQNAIRAFDPDIVIPIDYGGFNLRIIRWVHENGYRSIYYIPPKVWAWMPSRANRLARYAEHVLCILPFEVDFLRKYGVRADYTGNPVRDYILPVRTQDPSTIRQELGLTGEPVIALLPGSRKQEIQRILPVMAEMIPLFPGYRFVVCAHRNFSETFYRKWLDGNVAEIRYDQTLRIVRSARAALVTSGTATLETALLGTPQVVCYRTTPVSYAIARLLIRVRYISLVNLILDRLLVDELIQTECTAGRLQESLSALLNDDRRISEISHGYDDLDRDLDSPDAPSTAASVICRLAMRT